MARLGTLRVDQVLDYERDIKGKRLIRLRAGVGAGKNYWARHLLEKHPDLQILLITSRKNTAEAEAYHIGTDCKIHTSRLFNTRDKDWGTELPGNLMVCTNAYIDHFFKNIYSKDNPKTHLWNKFDLIFVDEVHSLTADASFANSPFTVERFIHHTLHKNPQCDIVVMSGTPESTDWLFTADHWGAENTSIDLYDKCVHLVPDKVYLMTQSVIAERIHYRWTKKDRLIYFVNSVKGMAELIHELMILGIPEDDLGIAFTESDNADKLPPNLVIGKEGIRKCLVEESRLPDEVKIFITTSQNKEGISIENDDIKYMFSECHNKSDLEQMAGRVRGNPDTGTGLYALVVVYDAVPHPTLLSYVEQEFDRILLDHVDTVIENHKQLVEASGKKYNPASDISDIQEKHHFLRYDYIAESFQFYKGREMCYQQDKRDQSTFRSLIDQIYDHMYYEFISPVTEVSVTGGYELNRKWFPYSTLYHSSSTGIPALEKATNELLSFLKEEQYLDVALNTEKQGNVMTFVHSLAQKYGQKELGFGRKIPTTLKPALKYFGLNVNPTSKHGQCDQIISLHCVSAQEN